LIIRSLRLRAAYKNHCHKLRILKRATPYELGDSSWRDRVRKAVAHQALRLEQLALLVPAAQPIEFIAADLDVHLLHGDSGRKGCDFVLRGQEDGDGSNGRRESELLWFREALLEAEGAVPVDAREGNGFVEGDLRGPL